jgi:hypothetical protein
MFFCFQEDSLGKVPIMRTKCFITLLIFLCLISSPVFSQIINRGFINLNTTQTGYLGMGQQHLYTFYVPSSQTITIEFFRTDGSRLDPYIVLQDSFGNQIATDDDGAGFPNSRLVRFLNSGSYRIIARDLGNNDSGNYRLIVLGQGSTPPPPPPPPPPPFGTPISVGQTVYGYLSAGGTNLYILSVPYSQSVTIEMFRTGGVNFDPYLVLQNASGMQIAVNDDGAGFPNARMTQFLNAGTYRILCREFGNNNSGTYRLSVLGGSVPPPPPPPPPFGTPILIGQTLYGYLSKGGSNVYILNVPFSRSVTIEMFRNGASNLDPYVIIQNSSGMQIAANDDGAGFPNARMTVFLNAGTYRIVCRAFANASSGNYRVTVR